MCNARLMKEKPKDAIHPESRQQLRTWLSQHHGREAGLWLVFNKKNSGKAVMSYSDIIEELLCFGWIDSKPNALDEDHSLLWIAPRKETANWSKLNKSSLDLLRIILKKKSVHNVNVFPGLQVQTPRSMESQLISGTEIQKPVNKTCFHQSIVLGKILNRARHTLLRLELI